MDRSGSRCRGTGIPEKKADLIPTLDNKYAYSYDQAHLRDYYEVNIDPTREGGIKSPDMQAAKKLIREKGALGISFYSISSISNAVTASVYDEENNAYYDPTEHGYTNHSVVAVGWDDTFSKDNFTQTPAGDGAWLVRNSWVDSEYEESYSGYFWLSYYNADLSNVAYAFDFDLTGNYDNNYQYDGSMINFSIGFNKDSIQGANVFQAKASSAGEELKAVAFYTDNSNVDYEVKIYVSDDPMSEGPVVGDPVATKIGTLSYPGYHTVALNSAVQLNKDQYYSVVVSLNKPGGKVNLGAEVSLTFEGDFACVAEKGIGKSYLYGGSTWEDLNNIEGAEAYGNLKIKAFTDNKVTAPVDLASANISVDTLTYTGSPLTPLVTVKSANGTVINSMEYTLEYSNNINAGTDTGRVVVKAKDGSTKCTGTKTVSFSIAKADIGKTIRYYDGSSGETYAEGVRYTGYETCLPLWEISRKFILKNRGVNLIEGTDYEMIDPEKNTFFDISTGQYQSYTITGKGNYTGTKTVPIGLDPIDIGEEDAYYSSSDGVSKWWTGADISAIPDQILSTSAQGNTPELTVTNKTRGKLTAGTDYTVAYTDNKAIGKATATVTGKGNYTGTKSVQFNIIPDPTAPFEIDSYAKLKQFAASVNGGNTTACAKLTADIVAKNNPGDEEYATDWTPIGNYTNEYIGTFDGQGHTITGLSTPETNADYVGLFGYVGASGTVKNVGLEGGKIFGGTYVGGIVGFNQGTVSYCYNTGDVFGNLYVGGVVGYENGGTLKYCYNMGAVSGVKDVGGVAGCIEESGTKYCFNTGAVSGKESGGIIGKNLDFRYVREVYYDKNISNAKKAVGDGKVSYRAALTTEEITGANAGASIGYDAEDENPWLEKANSDAYMFYPHLKGFNFDESGRQLSGEEIAPADWPAKVKRVAPPAFSPAGGNVCMGQFTVTISCSTKDANIYYTTNGSDPTAASTKYTGAITISSATTIKAVAIKDGMAKSKIVSATFSVAGHDWGTPTYTWKSETGKNGKVTWKCTAQRICKNNSKHIETETVEAAEKVTKEATTTAKGQKTYTATFKNSAFKQQIRTEDIPAKSLPAKDDKPSITLSETSCNMYIKDSKVITATLVKDSIKKVTSNKTAVASVKFKGNKITIKAGSKTGKAKITVTTKTKLTKTITVTVKKPTTTELKLSKPAVTLAYKGKKDTVKVTATPAKSKTGEAIKVKSENKKIATATINSKGVITIKAVKKGTTAVTVTAGKIKQTIAVTVTATKKK